MSNSKEAQDSMADTEGKAFQVNPRIEASTSAQSWLHHFPAEDGQIPNPTGPSFPI